MESKVVWTFEGREGIYRIAATCSRNQNFSDLEMELIFEKNWIYACHESEILKNTIFGLLRLPYKSSRLAPQLFGNGLQNH